MAVILAAGKGTRLKSRLPKVLHLAAGRPLLAWVINAARGAGCDRILVVIGHGGDEVRRAFPDEDLTFVLQEEQRGSGHALAQAEAAVREALLEIGAQEATLAVLSGDVPLVRPETLRGLFAAAEKGWGAIAVAEVEEPGSLGRVVANAAGGLERIVEAADAEPRELAIRRVNAGLYTLPVPAIFSYLEGLRSDNAKGELYLTDAVGAAAAGETGGVAIYDLEDPSEALGVNTRRELGRVHRRLIKGHLEALMEAGVSVLDPRRTVVEAGVRVGTDSVLHPGVTLLGETRVGAGCTLHQGAWVRDSTLADETVVEAYSVLDGAIVDSGCRVGPFARLRPAAHLESGAKVGNFVEIKNARLGPGAKAGHLAYLGDADVGAGANIGAGAVTCNYDGRSKHRTTIGAGAFIGSDTMLVAPVEVGDHAVTGAGSVITHDVPAEALAVERGRQRNLHGRGRVRGEDRNRRPEKPENKEGI